MGTRGSVIIFQEGKAKGYYNHSDSYPGSLGEEVLEVLQTIDAAKDGWKKFAENMKKVKLVSSETEAPISLQKKYQKFSCTGVSSGKLSEWYVLLRNLQHCDYLKHIFTGKVRHMLDGGNFPEDSLFCEYAYVIDLDKMVLELYRGFQEQPQPNNRFGETKNESGYFPCAKVGEIPLKGISDKPRIAKKMNKLYEKFEPQEAE